MPTIRLTLAYDGTDFAGWQHQKNGLSVQEALETALSKIIGRPVACRAAGRTDAGVHAMGQVVSFRLGCVPPDAGVPAAGAAPAAPPSSRPAAAPPPTGGHPTGGHPTGGHPTGEPPTGETPTSEPPTSEPLTSEPPTGEPPTGEPPAGERVVTLRSIIRGTNYHLPPAIRILDAQLAADEFDARFSASGKLYRYQLWNALTESPLHARTHWHLIAPLDLAAMQQAAALLVGHHDFRAFRSASCERLTTHRTMHRLAVVRQSDCPAAVHIEVEATAFLRNMVRILAGTLVDVGRGRLTPAAVAALLHSGDRTRAGPTAPAHGLILWRVDYGPRSGL